MRLTSKYGLFRELDYALNAISRHLARCADADMAFSYFEDFVVSSTAKSTVFELISSFDVVGEILFGIFSQSNTLSSYLINNPQKLFWLIENDTLANTKQKEDFYKEVFNLISKTDNFDRRNYYIRQYRKSEYLRIATREIIGAADFVTTMKELSHLAAALIEAALFCAKDRLKSKYETEEDGFSVIGMGKLGNFELNFSSDIDLLFVHKDESKSEYYNRLSRTLISVLNDNKEGGFVYRVDMRLRPGGKTSALSLSVEEYEDYYSTFGQMWERMALTKAYPVAGDKHLGFEFLNMIKPFVYKKSLDIEYIMEIRSLMFKIKKYSSKNLQSDLICPEKVDVKKGVGGIREIEFIVNYFQLVYGGRTPELEHISTVDALGILKKMNLLEGSIADFLKEAYLFLRRIEHKIQLLNEQQTQNLPTDYNGLKQLAKKLSMDVEEFLNRYKSVTDRVHSVFNDIFIRDRKIPVFGTVDDLEGFLKEHSLKNAEYIAVLIKEVVKKFLAKDVKRAIIEEIFDYSFKFVIKDMFEECVKGLSAVNPTYTLLMFEDKKMFDAFLKMLCVGLGGLLAQNEEVFEYFASNMELEFKTFDRYEFEKTKLVDTFNLLLNVFDYMPSVFSLFTKGFINFRAKKYDKNSKLCIVGYGKLATGELFIGSDLDLVFVSLDDSFAHIAEAQKIVKELRKFYDVDLRLRPYGDKGSLVCDVDYLKRYFTNSAWGWEKQAAQKSKVIYCGFESGIVEDIYKKFVISNSPSKGEILDMKRKIEHYKGKSHDIKSFNGGINDIEFLVQSVCFEKGCIKLGVSALHLLDMAENLHLIDTDILKEAYIFYMTLLNIHRLHLNSSRIDDFETLEFLTGSKGLKDKIEFYRKAVRVEFERWFGEC